MIRIPGPREIIGAVVNGASSAVAAAKVVGKIVINTVKGSFMADTSTKELDEALQAGFSLAVSLKNALADGKVSIDEILESVTDGKVRDSISRLINVIEAIVHGDAPELPILAGNVIDAVVDFLGHLKDALADGKVTLDEILHTVVDGDVRVELTNAIEGASKIPEELSGLDVWKIMALFQTISKWIPELVGGNK